MIWYLIAIFGIVWIGTSVNWGMIAIGKGLYRGLSEIAKALKK